ASGPATSTVSSSPSGSIGNTRGEGPLDQAPCPHGWGSLLCGYTKRPWPLGTSHFFLENAASRKTGRRSVTRQLGSRSSAPQQRRLFGPLSASSDGGARVLGRSL